MVKNPSADAGDVEDGGSIPGLGRILRGEYGNPPQYSCLQNPMDRNLVGYSSYDSKESDMTEAT